jgi:cytoskeleton protein RodZ
MSSDETEQTATPNAAAPKGRKRNRARELFHRALGAQAPGKPTEFGDSEVGRLLCATRMRLGKDLQAIAKVLHIRYNYLVAIEDGRYEDLPGQAYAIGFVRAYAEHLELNGEEVVRRYKEDSTGLKRKAALEFPIPTPDSGIPSGLALLAAILLGGVVYGVWYALSGIGHQAPPVVQEVPSRLLSPEPTTAAAPAADATPATTADAAPPANPPAAAEAPQAAPPPAPAAVAPAAPVPDTTAAAVPPPVGLSDLPPVPPPPPDEIEVRAKSDSWIQIRDGEKVVLTRLLHKGDTYKVPPDHHGLTLMTANAGGIEILLNGQPTEPLGDVGAVASGVALDANHLTTGD